MQTHVKVVGALFIVFGLFGCVLAMFSSFLFSVLGGIVGSSGERGAAAGVAVLGLAGVALAVFLLVVSVPAIICGWGLLTKRSWARILGIILASIGLIRVPFGTIFGIYALWVLFNKDTEALFDRPGSAGRV
jgi:hypothetical protein